MIHAPSARVSYGVEHDSYAYQLTKDMEMAPSLTDVLRISLHTPRGWRLPYIWAGGASFNPEFRLIGPWKLEGAAEILMGELWETISRRSGLFGNIPMVIVPAIYLSTVNLYYFIYALFWGALASIRLAKPPVPRNDGKGKFEELARIEQMKMMQEAAMTGDSKVKAISKD